MSAYNFATLLHFPAARCCNVKSKLTTIYHVAPEKIFS